MIVYRLKCDLNHRFDAWFQSGASFEEQQKQKLLECPHCGSTGISKAPMSPRISKTSHSSLGTEILDTVESEGFPYESMSYNYSDKTNAIQLHKDCTGSQPLSLDHLEKTLQSDKMKTVNPALIRKALLSLKENIRQSCDDVGNKFAEEARRIHYGETEKRSIYGQASFEEIFDLRQEGVEVSALPPFPKEDA